MAFVDAPLHKRREVIEQQGRILTGTHMSGRRNKNISEIEHQKGNHEMKLNVLLIALAIAGSTN